MFNITSKSDTHYPNVGNTVDSIDPKSNLVNMAIPKLTDKHQTRNYAQIKKKVYYRLQREKGNEKSGKFYIFLELINLIMKLFCLSSFLFIQTIIRIIISLFIRLGLFGFPLNNLTFLLIIIC